jgi:hypothetical protein
LEVKPLLACSRRYNMSAHNAKLLEFRSQISRLFWGEC